MNAAAQLDALQPVQDEQRALDAPELAQGGPPLTAYGQRCSVLTYSLRRLVRELRRSGRLLRRQARSHLLQRLFHDSQAVIRNLFVVRRQWVAMQISP
ncbi:hypothetical protein M622_15285 [Thauera terpenica 58Eu]|uniref:Transposase DDE domain-containing protein n=1 Tax=Thauera terpenica 58Eu TaxID=1348657 RepID=S9ZE99_9RHOO|nr:hypothetical protein M622_15285 [Thauera terpenica 58Eu]